MTRRKASPAKVVRTSGIWRKGFWQSVDQRNAREPPAHTEESLAVGPQERNQLLTSGVTGRIVAGEPGPVRPSPGDWKPGQLVLLEDGVEGAVRRPARDAEANATAGRLAQRRHPLGREALPRTSGQLGLE